MANATLEVETKLADLLRGLSDLKKVARDLGKSFEEASDKVGESTRDQSKKTEDFLTRLSGLGKQVAQNIATDFKALASVGGVLGTFEFGKVLEHAVSASSTLTKSIALLRQSLNLSTNEADQLKSRLVSAFAAARLGAADAANAIDGLQGKGIQSVGLVEKIALLSAQIATARGERGSAGQIAGGAVDILQAQGINPNKNPQAIEALLNSVIKTAAATGFKASAVESTYRTIIESSDVDRRKGLTPQGLGQQSVLASVLGPQFLGLIQNVNKNPALFNGVLREFQGAIKPSGEVDLPRARRAFENLRREGLGTTVGAQTYGFDAQGAAAIKTALDNFDQLAPAIEKYNQTTVDLQQATYDGMTAMEKLGSIVDVASASVGTFSDKLFGTFDAIRLFGEKIETISGNGAASVITTGLVGAGSLAVLSKAVGMAKGLLPGGAAAAEATGAAGLGSLALGGLAVGGAGLAGYGIANALGAEKLGKAIGDAVYSALHSRNDPAIEIHVVDKTSQGVQVNRGAGQ